MAETTDGRYIHGELNYTGDVRSGFEDPTQKFGPDMFGTIYYAVGAVYNEQTNKTTVSFSGTPPIVNVDANKAV